MVSSRNVTSRKGKNGIFQRFIKLVKLYGNKETFQLVLLNPDFTWLIAMMLIFAEIVVNVLVIEKVPYTEIDWKAYMQEVEGVVNGTFDYAKLKGDTGPLVYPAGFVYIFSVLYFVTNRGTNIYFAQYIFSFLYLITLIFVFRIYHKTKKVPPYALLFLCCTSYRIHSIYILRMFNDPVAILFFYIAVNLFLDKKWIWGCFVYSLAVSIKMNILLFAPALLILMLSVNGVFKTVKLLFICALTQVVLSLPFLLSNPWSYLKMSFDFGRVFLYEWTVNWRFLDENIFVNRSFHLCLLSLHIIILCVFTKQYWIKLIPNLQVLKKGQMELSPNALILPLFTANLIGISFSRSLHYQFYVWYFHTLPYLLWNTKLPTLFRLCVLGVIELCWNTYPSTVWSSAVLHLCHLILLISLYFTQPIPIQIALKKSNIKKEN